MIRKNCIFSKSEFKEELKAYASCRILRRFPKLNDTILELSKRKWIK